MYNLSKIKISNIRKFGKDVEIPIEKGATIFLAPNGTGKTSLFEAIELGLTGAVQRLGNSTLNNLIRDKYQEAAVKLEFGNEVFNTTELIYDQPPKITGNIKDLFGTINSENIPFLLRITHLLDQQSSKWFVQSESGLAGTLLQNLSIGRDASKANEVMSSARRAANQRMSQIEQEKNAIKEQLDTWLNLLQRREIEQDAHTKPLRSLNEIRDEINDISVQFNDERDTVGNELANIIVGHKIILQRVKSKVEIRDRYLLDLIQLEYSLAEFENQKSAKESIDKEIQALNEKIKIEEGKINVLQESLLTKLKSITEVQTLLEKTEQENNRLELLNKNKTEFDRVQKAIADLGLEIEKQKKLGEGLEKVINDAIGINFKHLTLKNIKGKLDEERRQLELGDRLIGQWRALLQDLASKKAEFETNGLQIVHLKSEKGILELTLKSASKKYYELLQKFNGLTSATDAIKEAVGAIALNLPKTAGECPVCMTQFKPVDLQERMNKAINLIAPQLSLAKVEVDNAQAEMLLAMSKVEEIDRKIVNAEELSVTIRNDSADIEMTIAVEIKPALGMSTSVDDSVNYLGQRMQKFDSDFSAYEAEFNSVGPLVGPDQLKKIEHDHRESIHSINRLQEELGNSEMRRSNLKSTITSLESLGIANQLGQQTEIVNLQQQINTLNNEVNTIRNNKLEIDAVTEEIKKKINSSQENANIVLLRINILLEKWEAAGLKGIYQKNILDQSKIEAQTHLSEIKQVLQALEDIDVELTGWNAHETFFNTQNSITALRGDLTEVDYDKAMQSNYKKACVQLEEILEKVAILNDFSVNLGQEIDSVNERIQAINPYWKRLLQRTVVDPRFAQTTLSSYSYYKKPQADVKVGLHGTEVLAADVASEAQLTDLQLTFLLSMAYKYQWSKWRCLLLDDPTQHHDLVHAAGVFDLLRDYIIDHDFQVLLATHDPVQAKFFMRKLQNDGVPVKLWNLKPTRSGVFAIPG